MFRRARAEDGAARFVAEARSHLGYVPGADGRTPFGAACGYDGLSWNGAFVDVVARRSSTELPAACLRPADGLSGFLRALRGQRRPAVGDVVFYNLSVDGVQGGPHLGIVTDVSRWATDGSFRAVEAQVDSGLPRASSQLGVFERTRFATDVMIFGRPDFRARRATERTESDGGLPLVTVAHVTTGRRSRATETLQFALAACVGARSMSPGVWCSRTLSAMAEYQRRTGRLGADASGRPDAVSLERLAQDSGLFRVR